MTKKSIVVLKDSKRFTVISDLIIDYNDIIIKSNKDLEEYYRQKIKVANDFNMESLRS